MVLIDELGTSTDPEEGAALAKAILMEMNRRGIPAVATSHHHDLAAFVQESPGMVNASVELDPDTLSPTYRLNMGLPERSYALTIATRLGMPQGIIDDARSMLSGAFRQTEGLLNDLQRERHQALERHREAQEELNRAQVLRQELEARLADLEHEEGHDDSGGPSGASVEGLRRCGDGCARRSAPFRRPGLPRQRPRQRRRYTSRGRRSLG